MKALEYNHRILITEASEEEMNLLKRTLRVNYYRPGNGRRVLEKSVNLLYKEGDQYYFPPGMLEFVADKLDKIGEDLYLDDCRSIPFSHLRFAKENDQEMWENQQKAIEELKKEENNVGFVSSIMGSGKSRIIEEIVRLNGVNTLIIVPTEAIQSGLMERFSKFVPKKMLSDKIPKDKDFFAYTDKVEDKNYEASRPEEAYLMDKGFKRYGGNWVKADKASNELSGRKKKKAKNQANIVITCFQSLSNASQAYLDSVEQIIVDEGHTARNNTIRNALLNMPNAYYRYFLSATMWADLKQDMMLLMAAASNNLIYEELAFETIGDGRAAEPELISKRAPLPPHPVGRWAKDKQGNSKIVHTKDFDTMIKLGIVGNSTRNDEIVEIALSEYYDGNRVLICVNEELHGHFLKEIVISKHVQNIKDKIYGLSKDEILKRLNREDEGEIFDVYAEELINKTLEGFDPGYVFGSETSSIKSELIEDMSYGTEASISIGTSAVGIGVDTKNINVVILADVRKSSVKLLQAVGRGSRIKAQETAFDSFSYRVYNFEDWFHPKLMEHSRKRLNIFNEYFLGKESVTKKKWKKSF